MSALKRNKELVILRADQGNATVFLDRYSYHAKVKELLDDLAYQRISKDLTGRIGRWVSSLVKIASIPLEFQKHAILHSSQQNL